MNGEKATFSEELALTFDYAPEAPAEAPEVAANPAV